ncbi:MAG: hypothetical protein IID15_09605, partial [Candidatus Marinimicrobia bacterium]|nr:hypothetical protein [Candidatus Neomarinimicrobiota bacterium]
PMGFFTLEGLLGRVEVVVFSDLFEKVQEYLTEDSKVFVIGKPTSRGSGGSGAKGGNGSANGVPGGGEIKLLAEEIIPLEAVRQRLARVVYVRLAQSRLDPHLVEQLGELANRSRGSSELRFQITRGEDASDVRRIRATKLRVAASDNLLTQLRDLVGQSNVWVAPN